MSYWNNHILRRLLCQRLACAVLSSTVLFAPLRAQSSISGGIDCDSAVNINSDYDAAGRDLTVTFTTSDVGEMQWYSFDTQKGAQYIIQNISGEPVELAYSLAGCSKHRTDDLAAGDSLSDPVVGTGSTLRLGWMLKSGTGSVTWRIAEIADNRICTNAEQISLGWNEVDLRKGGWYRLDVKKDSSYVVETSDGSDVFFDLYRSCDASDKVVEISSVHEFTSPFTGEALFNLARTNSNSAEATFSFRKADNGGCGRAASFNLDEDIPMSTGAWWAVGVEAGKHYRIVPTSAPQAGDDWSMTMEVWSDCFIQQTIDSIKVDVEGSAIRAVKTGNYLFTCSEQENVASWKLVEVTDNSVCEYGEPVTVGEENQLPDAPAWYKLSATAGTAYTIESNAIDAPDFWVYSDCDSEPIEGGTTISFYAPTAGDYLIAVYPLGPDPDTWAVNITTENLTCGTAETVVIGDKYPVDESLRYYRLNVAAGETYLFKSNYDDTFFDIGINQCLGNSVAPADKTLSSGDRLTAVEDGYITIRVGNYNVADNWSVSLFTENSLCENASARTLGATVNVEDARDYYFKYHLDAGKTYLLDATSLDTSLEVYRGCMGKIVAEANSGHSALFRASETGDYIVKTVGNAGTSFVVSEATQTNTVCSSAQAMDINTFYDMPQNNYAELWYKASLEADSIYHIDSIGLLNSNVPVEVFTACNGDTVDVDYDNLTFTAPATGDYLIKISNSYQRNEKTGLTKLNGNVTCATSRTVMPGENISDAVKFTEIWYNLQVEAGKWYTINIGNAGDDFVVISDCDLPKYRNGSAMPLANDYAPAFQAPGDGIVKLVFTRINGNTVEWRYTEKIAATIVNTECEYAQRIGLGEERNDHWEVSSSSTNYYYRLAVELGKTYRITSDNSEHFVYVMPNCSDPDIANGYVGGEGFSFTAKGSGDIIIRCVNGATAAMDFKWKVVETDGPDDNTVCDDAESVMVAELNYMPDDDGKSHYYKFDAEVGHYYRIKSEALNHNSSSFYIYESCDGGIITMDNAIFRVSGNTCIVEIRSNDGFETWMIEEVLSPNVGCNEAIEIPLNVERSEMLTYDIPLWFKFAVEAGKSYTVSGYGSAVCTVYSACGEAEPVASDSVGGSVLTFVAANDGYGYVCMSNISSEEISFMTYIKVDEDIMSCASAQGITLGESAVAGYNGSGYYWFKTALEADKYYRVEVHEPVSTAVFDKCGSSPQPLIHFPYGDFFRPTRGGEYFFMTPHSDALSMPWIKVSEADMPSGNATCSGATDLPLNALNTITLPSITTERWYSVNLTADKYYEFKLSVDNPINLYIHSNCESSDYLAEFFCKDEGKYVFRPKSDGTYYLEPEIDNTSSVEQFTGTLTISELTDNRACEHPLAIKVGETVKVKLNHDESRFFSFEAEAGKTYLLTNSMSSVNGKGNPVENYLAIGAFDCSDVDQWTAIVETDNAGSVMFDVPASGVYMLQAKTADWTDRQSAEFSFTITELVSGSLCSNALPASTGTMTNSHASGRALWYEFIPTTTGDYTIIAPNGQFIALYSDCYTRDTICSGVLDFTATAGTPVLISFASSGMADYSYSWILMPEMPVGLTSLSVEGYRLSPDFSPMTYDYSINVPNSVTAISIFATAAAGTITVKNATGSAVTGVSSKFDLASLAEGNNAFTITVSNGDKSQVYTLTVNRAATSAGNDATLKTLSLGEDIVLSPTFSPAVTNYTATVAGDVASIAITATANDVAANVNGIGNKLLKHGDNRFILTVIAADGSLKTYTVDVFCDASTVTPPPSVTAKNIEPITATVEQGATRQFTASYTVEHGDDTFKWSLSGNVSVSTTLVNGLLTVAENESATTLFVAAVSIAIPTDSVVATVTVTAKPIPQYIVTFDSQGGTAVESQTVEKGKTATEPTAPTRDGYTFNGWWDNVDSPLSWNFATPITHDTTLVAKWTELPPTVTNKSIEPQTAIVEQGHTRKFTASFTVEKGENTYTWHLAGNLSAKTAIDSIGLLTVADDETAKTLTVTATSTAVPTESVSAVVTVTAKPIPQYTVTFDSQGGTDVEPQTVEKGKTATEPTAPTRDGYTFNGWWDNVDSPLQWDFTTPITHDTTLVAKWTELPLPIVKDHSITPSAITVEPDTTVQFTASFTVENGENTCTWKVTGKTSVFTYIVNGLLTVDKSEKAAELFVIATSTAVPSDSVYAIVTVNQHGDIPGGETGIDDDLAYSLSLYPNAFVADVTVAGAQGCLLRVCNTAGKVVHTQRITSSREIIPMSNQPSGLYLFRFERNGQNATVKGFKL